MTSDPESTRAGFEDRVDALRGRRVFAAEYYDLHNFGQEPFDWNHGDWHHAVMGVELRTDAGPVTVTWTATFFPYGRGGVPRASQPPRCRWRGGGTTQRAGSRVDMEQVPGRPDSGRNNIVGHLHGGPSMKANGEIVGPPYTVEVPTALRLDFQAGPVWFVAGQPQLPRDDVFIPGDEIIVVFAESKMRQMGYADLAFVG